MDLLSENTNLFMEYLWELNTLVNDTSEGRSLERRFLERADDYAQQIKIMSFEEGQREFLINDLELALSRLKDEAGMLDKIIINLESLRQTVSESVRIHG